MIELELFYEAPTQGANTERCGLKHQLNTRAEGIHTTNSTPALHKTARLKLAAKGKTDFGGDEKKGCVAKGKTGSAENKKSETANQLVWARAALNRGCTQLPKAPIRQMRATC